MSCIPDDAVVNPTVLEEAEAVVGGPRRRDYDHPKRNFARIARAWSDIVGTEITPRQTALMMIALKVSRDSFTPKRDNLVDICGYARCIELLDDEPETTIKVDEHPLESDRGYWDSLMHEAEVQDGVREPCQCGGHPA